MYQQHTDPDVQQAILRLCDDLCHLEAAENWHPVDALHVCERCNEICNCMAVPCEHVSRCVPSSTPPRDER